MSEKDLYKVLGLTDNEKQLRGEEFNKVVSKKYKDLAKKYHPDRWVNGTDEEKKEAEEKFKDISNAYSILSDEQKRQEYDFGGNMGGGWNPFGGDWDPFSMFRGGHNRQRVVKGEDDEASIIISLEDAFNGGKKEITYSTYVECSECNGTGSKDKKKHTCPHCNGSGREVKTFRQGNMVSQQITICSHCGGSGEIIDNPCKKCKGTGLEYKQKKITIDIPIGINNGQVFKYEGMGRPPKGGNGINGDLYVKFIIKDNEYFEREKQHLLHYEYIPFEDALLGCDIKVKTIDGEEIKIKIPELTEDGKTFVYNGKGMKFGYGRGDYGVVIKYKLPKKLNNKQKDLLKELRETHD